ncbi:MAG: InlB B-repeat-containing protein, partial [Firmicutes bacterium]|nr:InlB B-repeat-containing protein [Candidatus Caballimonas caccae]
MKKTLVVLLLLATILCFATACDSIGLGGNKGGNVSYTVVFDSDGGRTLVQNQTVLKGKKATEPTETMVKDKTATEKFAFDGWYLDNVPWNFETDTVTDNITLKAKWNTTLYYTVKF